MSEGDEDGDSGESDTLSQNGKRNYRKLINRKRVVRKKTFIRHVMKDAIDQMNESNFDDMRKTHITSVAKHLQHWRSLNGVLIKRLLHADIATLSKTYLKFRKKEVKDYNEKMKNYDSGTSTTHLEPIDYFEDLNKFKIINTDSYREFVHDNPNWIFVLAAMSACITSADAHVSKYVTLNGEPYLEESYVHSLFGLRIDYPDTDNVDLEDQVEGAEFIPRDEKKLNVLWHTYGGSHHPIEAMIALTKSNNPTDLSEGPSVVGMVIYGQYVNTVATNAGNPKDKDLKDVLGTTDSYDGFATFNSAIVGTKSSEQRLSKSGVGADNNTLGKWLDDDNDVSYIENNSRFGRIAEIFLVCTKPDHTIPGLGRYLNAHACHSLHKKNRWP